MYERQKELLDQEQLATKTILIIGAGAIGRQIALTLAAMGAKHITICDADKVDDSNVATQMYERSSIGQPKVEALKDKMLEVNPDGGFRVYNSWWDPRLFECDRFDVVFSCVDQMNARRSIWLYCKRRSVGLFIDVRMLAEIGHVLCFDRAHINEYEATLFTDAEALEGRCTRRGTLYMAQILANQAVGRLALFMRGIEASRVYTYNLIGEMV